MRHMQWLLSICCWYNSHCSCARTLWPISLLPDGVSLCRIVLKSNCVTPIDVWLVSGHHQHQQKEDDEAAFGNSHATMSSGQVKHEPDGMAGKTLCLQLESLAADAIMS